MRNLLSGLLVLAVISLPIAAHADTIDNFVLTDPIGDTMPGAPFIRVLCG